MCTRDRLICSRYKNGLDRPGFKAILGDRSNYAIPTIGKGHPRKGVSHERVGNPIALGAHRFGFPATVDWQERSGLTYGDDVSRVDGVVRAGVDMFSMTETRSMRTGLRG